MKTIFDLPEDLVEDEIISRVPMTSLRSVRSTCRKWNALCKNRVFFGKAGAAAKKQFMGLVMMDSKICIMNFDLCKDGDLVNPCIKQVSILDQINIFKVFHCDGFFLCLAEDKSSLVVCNPNLEQTRLIKPMQQNLSLADRFALGYDNNNLNYKILRITDQYHPVTDRHLLGFELYDFTSSSWKVLGRTQEWDVWSYERGVSLKGNAYFPARKNVTERGETRPVEGFLLCFDFTTESFAPLLPLPFQPEYGEVFTSLSCVRQEQLAVLYQYQDARETIEISVTDKIGPNVVSWTKFLKVVNGFWMDPYSFSFFIDEEKKIAVAFVLEMANEYRYQTAHVIGKDGYFKSVRIRESPGNSSYPRMRYCSPLVV